MTGRIVTFYLGENLFGMDISEVREAVSKVSYTPVPGTSLYIAGLMNMRGQVVTLFNLNKLMGYGCGENVQGKSCIILKNNRSRTDYAGFLVDKLGEVIDVRDEWLTQPPSNMRNVEMKFVKELVMLEDRLVILVEPESVIAECLA